MPRQIHPLCCPRKLASVTASFFLTAVLNLLGCSIADRAAPIDGNYRVVERVIDGDTLVMANGERVRLIGVDTPETKHPRKPVEDFGNEAAVFTRRMVEGKRVRLELTRQMRHGLTRTARNRGARWLTCSWKMAHCSMRRLSNTATGSRIHVFLLHGWRSLGS